MFKFKHLLTALAALFAAAACAATDVNKATQAELEAIKGVGPSIAGKILDERKKATFKDWPDFIERVKGVGEGNAAKFSADGLTVGGASFKGAAPAAKKDDKPAAKATAAAPAPAPAPAAAKAEAKPAEKATAAAKPADKPAATAAPMATKADAKPAAKDDKKSAAKDDKKSAAKTADAASAPKK